MSKKMLYHGNTIHRYPQFLAGETYLEHIVSATLEVLQLPGGSEWPPTKPAHVFSNRICTLCGTQLRKYVVLLRRAISQNDTPSLYVRTERRRKSDLHLAPPIF